MDFERSTILLTARLPGAAPEAWIEVPCLRRRPEEFFQGHVDQWILGIICIIYIYVLCIYIIIYIYILIYIYIFIIIIMIMMIIIIIVWICNHVRCINVKLSATIYTYATIIWNELCVFLCDVFFQASRGTLAIPITELRRKPSGDEGGCHMGHRFYHQAWDFWGDLRNFARTYGPRIFGGKVCHVIPTIWMGRLTGQRWVDGLILSCKWM